MRQLAKSQKREIRRLNGLAYERELSTALEKLSASFKDWQNKKTDCWELENVIHKFHNQTTRELYKKYECSIDDLFLVCASFKKGLIKKGEIADNIKKEVEEMMKNFRW